MRTETREVKHKSKTVAEIEVPIYESLDEAAEALTPEKALGLLNKQNVIRLQANERQKSAGTRVGKKRLAKAAYNCLTPDEVQAVAGDYDALQELLNSPEIQARAKELLGEE